MREESLIKRIKNLIEEYTYKEPFSVYLRNHFRQHPEMGARDRRETREWSYSLFRIGRNLKDFLFEERLAVACFLSNSSNTSSLTYLINKYSKLNIDELSLSLEEKLEIVSLKYEAFSLEKIFFMLDELSPQIDKHNFYLSFLKKPFVWIRLREKYRKKVIDELNERNISFFPDNDALILSFLPDAALDKTDSYLKGYFEIQDRSSQQTKNFFKAGKNEYWWDACAGAGGKSLLLKESASDVHILATDNRESILKNYLERMKRARYQLPEIKLLNLSASGLNLPHETFDGIIADVPCSGSGTWSRSPEWLMRDLGPKVTEQYVPLQRNIISNILPSLKAGFPLIFITCSVFKKENEENIQFFIDHFPLKLEKSTYLEGYGSGSDTLFVARFIKDR